MSKILLISPPCIELYPRFRNIIPKHPPLALAYLASFLEENGISAEIYDSFIENESIAGIERKISNTDAEIVGITSVTATIKEAIQIAVIAKKFGKKTILGGVHVSALPEITLKKNNCFDIGVIGEGEITLSELMNGKNPSEIDGIVYRSGNNVIINKKRARIEDLAILPHPARHLLKNNLYRPATKEFIRNRKFFTIITSRGCPFQCNFCASKTIWESRVKFRPVADIFSELDKLKAMDMEQLKIIDDTFTLDLERVKLICAKLKSLGIQWACNGRVDSVTPEMLRIFKDSNCVYIEYGIESGNQNILNIMKKGITLEQINRTVKATRKIGIAVCCSFIIGNINDTKKSVKDTLRLAKTLNPDFVQFSILTPYPGTEAYEICREKGYLIREVEDYTSPKYFAPVISLPGLPPKKLKKLLIRAYQSFYLRPYYIAKWLYKRLLNF